MKTFSIQCIYCFILSVYGFKSFISTEQARGIFLSSFTTHFVCVAILCFMFQAFHLFGHIFFLSKKCYFHRHFFLPKKFTMHSFENSFFFCNNSFFCKHKKRNLSLFTWFYNPIEFAMEMPLVYTLCQVICWITVKNVKKFLLDVFRKRYLFTGCKCASFLKCTYVSG